MVDSIRGVYQIQMLHDLNSSNRIGKWPNRKLSHPSGSLDLQDLSPKPG